MTRMIVKKVLHGAVACAIIGWPLSVVMGQNYWRTCLYALAGWLLVDATSAKMWKPVKK